MEKLSLVKLTHVSILLANQIFFLKADIYRNEVILTLQLIDI